MFLGGCENLGCLEEDLTAVTYEIIMLDNIILGIEDQMPNAGYCMAQGHLVSMSLHILWWRMMASMHSVNAAEIFRDQGRSCVVRGPLSFSLSGPQ